VLGTSSKAKPFEASRMTTQAQEEMQLQRALQLSLVPQSMSPQVQEEMQLQRILQQSCKEVSSQKLNKEQRRSDFREALARSALSAGDEKVSAMRRECAHQSASTSHPKRKRELGSGDKLCEGEAIENHEEDSWDGVAFDPSDALLANWPTPIRTSAQFPSAHKPPVPLQYARKCLQMRNRAIGNAVGNGDCFPLSYLAASSTSEGCTASEAASPTADITEAVRRMRIDAVHLLSGDGSCEGLFGMPAFRQGERLPPTKEGAETLFRPWRDSFFWKGQSSQGTAFVAFMWAIAATGKQAVAVLQRSTDAHGRSVYLNPVPVYALRDETGKLIPGSPTDPICMWTSLVMVPFSMLLDLADSGECHDQQASIQPNHAYVRTGHFEMLLTHVIRKCVHLCKYMHACLSWHTHACPCWGTLHCC
jgi:hypothetical protein